MRLNQAPSHHARGAYLHTVENYIRGVLGGLDISLSMKIDLLLLFSLPRRDENNTQ